MSAENDDDVKVPARRRRASDDEAEEAEFHDAAEYAASVADSQAAVDQEDRGADEPRSEGGDDGGRDHVDEATGEEEVTETEEQPGDQDQADLAADRKKAKLREPFEVPTSGAFWLHDDRFGGEEPQVAEPPRSGDKAAERKARSDTEGRWLHDKFSALETGEPTDDDSSENAFSWYRRGRGGRGMRGGRGRGGRGGDGLSGRGRGVSSGRGSRYDIGGADGYGSEPNEAPPGLGDSQQEALPQGQPRAPRASTRSSGAFQASHEEDAGTASGAPALGGRGRGRGDRGGRGGEFSGRGRGERSFSPDGANREYGTGAEYGGRGGRGGAGRGRGRDDGGRADGAPVRGGYANGGRSVAGRGYGGRGAEAYVREAGGAAGPTTYSSNGGAQEGGGRGRGRGAGRSSSAEFQGRGFGTGGRGVAGAQRQPPPHQQQQQKSERTLDDEFPPLPGSGGAIKPSVSLTLSAETPSQQHPGGGGGAVDAGAPATQGVRRYSKMAGKVAGGGGDAGVSVGPDVGRQRGEGGGARASKLSAAAPTFEPAPATTGRQQQQAPPPQQQQPSVPSVPVAFGAPLQPMTVVTTAQHQPPPPPPAQPMGAVPEPYGPAAGAMPMAPHGSQLPMQYMPQQQQYQQPPPPQVQGQMQQQGYMPMQQQQPMQPAQQQQQPPPPPPMMSSPMPPPQGMQQPPQQQVQQQQQQYGGGGGGGTAGGGGGMYGTSFTDMEAWYQDAYQKALATGMDPQQAYSAVQGYVQGMQMAFQHFNMQAQSQQQQAAQQQQQQQQQQRVGGYPAAPPMMQQGPPPGP